MKYMSYHSRERKTLREIRCFSHMEKWLQNLFVFNERVTFVGRQRYGCFGGVPVGAINVGNVKVNLDTVSIAPNTPGRDNQADLESSSSHPSPGPAYQRPRPSAPARDVYRMSLARSCWCLGSSRDGGSRLGTGSGTYMEW